MLAKPELKRINVSDILNHPWFKDLVAIKDIANDSKEITMHLINFGVKVGLYRGTII